MSNYNLETSLHYNLLEINQLTPNILQVFLTPKKIGEFSFLAGQYLEILYSDNTYHPFSIANIPNNNEILELHIRQIEKDLALAKTISELKKTGEIIVRGPYGHAYYRKNTPQNNIIILAGGTGFAYAKAIIEQAIFDRETRPIYFYWSVKNANDLYLENLPTENWTKYLDAFQYIPVLSEKKIYADKIVIKDHPNLSDFQVYASGPMKMIQNAYQLFSEFGLKKEAMYSDMLFLA